MHWHHLPRVIRRVSTRLLALGGVLWALHPAPAQPATIVPLPQAHSHNDYLQERPLLDALDHGFCSVEADIFLVDDRLLVAHERSQLRPERTLEALYLKPLLERVRQHGGCVYTPGVAFHLLIDIKSDSLPTYQALDRLLQAHAEMLTRFESDRTTTNAVTVTISGNRPREYLEQQSVRFAGYDGRLTDLDSETTPRLIPLVSDNWQAHFQWRGNGPLTEPECMKLRELVRRAHEQGRAIRFWANPDLPEGWAALRNAGVDLINTDNLSGLREFLLQPQSH
ncbi:MAG: phosphatidylinositol-specific phospholipase C/glycerophosphodiester phosphodiesterase family protein [Verrucomicrobia bacterium]|nr:phosphatidylinositol-specific phospholipase C/glycerophosphodiester phosphodiesterase family protein [Verrucomicrobiota bacterium]